MRIWRNILCAALAAAVLVPAAAATPAAEPKTLSDVEGHWAQEEIEAAMAEGWVDGYPDGSFRPEETITRAEFTKMSLDAIHLTPDSETVQWMQENAWVIGGQGKAVQYTPSLADMDTSWLTLQGWTEAALYSGLVVPDDYAGKRFQPDGAISRYEIARQTVRAMGLVRQAAQPVTEGFGFADQDQFSVEQAGYISQAARADVVRGYPDHTFCPDQTATRAEAVVMVRRMLDYIEGDGAPAVKTVLTHGTAPNLYTRETDQIRLHQMDGILYASVRDIFREEGELLCEAGVLSAEQVDAGRWYPLEQEAVFLKNLTYAFQAGSDRCINGRDTLALSIHDSDEVLCAPVRLIYGELMIPVLNLEDPDAGRFDPAHFDPAGTYYQWLGDWDADIQTLTIHTYMPAPNGT